LVPQHVAVRVVECWLDESGPKLPSCHATETWIDAAHYGAFARAAGARGTRRHNARGSSPHP
jgi:hypothetical protein